MAILPIIVVGDPLLRKRARRITAIGDPSLQRLIDDMAETMHAAHGVGLAAPQVGAGLRLATISIPPEHPLLVVINPQVLRRSGRRQLDEGCLSIPGYIGVVNRSKRVTVAATDRFGTPYRLARVSGLLAQALEHEIDHLNGILYLDHLVSHEALRAAGARVIEHDVLEEPAPVTSGVDE